MKPFVGSLQLPKRAQHGRLFMGPPTNDDDGDDYDDYDNDDDDGKDDDDDNDGDDDGRSYQWHKMQDCP